MQCRVVLHPHAVLYRDAGHHRSSSSISSLPPDSTGPDSATRLSESCHAGLWNSRAFLHIWILVLGLQLLIMLTPIGQFFRITQQSWEEWMFAIGIGIAALPLCLLTKNFSRYDQVVGMDRSHNS